MSAKRYELKDATTPRSDRRDTRFHKFMTMPALPFLFLLLTGVMHGQSIDGFDPNANSTVNTIVVQPDGKVLIGGAFTTLSPNGGAVVTRNHIARLNPDGTLDTAFNPNVANPSSVSSIALQTDGKILVGGNFLSVGGQLRRHIARLNPDGSADTTFDPNPNTRVIGIAVQTDGKILVGGAFTMIGGQFRNNLARLDPSTGLADSFNPNPDSLAFLFGLQSDGKIVVAGIFSIIGGQSRVGIARLDAVTGLADAFEANLNDSPYSVVVQPDDKVLVAGRFNLIGGQARELIARLDGTTGLPDSFNPGADGEFMQAVALQADGKVVVGGNFLSIGFQTRHNLARLEAASGLADSLNPNPNGVVHAIAVQGDGKILVGGQFTAFTPNGEPSVVRNRIARLEKNPPPAATPTPIPGAPTLGNISTRLRVETGANVLIGGFIVTGMQPKRIIVRGIGPSLPLAGALADPTLELRNSSGGLIRSNDNWRIGGQEGEIIATGIPPSNDLEAAIVANLPAHGSAYTAIMLGANGGTGIGVVEAYDLDPTVNSKLANISTRGLVQTGDDVLIGGLIVLGQNPLRVIVRAIGPSLPLLGALENPTLDLRDGNGALIAFNDNWRDDPAQESEIIATGIPPTDDLESAIVRDLAPGSYTAIVRGVNKTIGIAVVEAYGLN